MYRFQITCDDEEIVTKCRRKCEAFYFTDESGFARAAKGGIRTMTLRAFTEAEYREIIAALP
jgi:hypothetical protein